MTRSEGKPAIAAVKEVLGQSPDMLRELIREVVQDFLEAEMDEVIGASKGERVGSAISIELETHRAINPRIAIGNDRLGRQIRSRDAQIIQRANRRPYRQKLNQPTAYFGDIGFDTDHISGAQRICLALDPTDRRLARLVDQRGQIADLALAKRFDHGLETARHAQ